MRTPERATTRVRAERPAPAIGPSHACALLIVRLAFGLLCGGCDEPTAPRPQRAATPTSSARVYRIGELSTQADYSMSVESVRECPPEPGFPPAPGARRIGVEVAIEGLSDRQVPVNPFYATLTDNDDDRYGMAFHGCTPELAPVRVTRDQKAQGFISFEVPKAARGFQLRYDPKLVSAQHQVARFSVELR